MANSRANLENLHSILCTRLEKLSSTYLKHLFVSTYDGTCSADSYRIDFDETTNAVIFKGNYDYGHKLVRPIENYEIGTVIDAIRIEIHFPEQYCEDILSGKTMSSNEIVKFKMNLKFYQNKYKPPLNHNLENMIELLNLDCTLSDLLVVKYSDFSVKLY